jgi:hypothetical protein
MAQTSRPKVNIKQLDKLDITTADLNESMGNPMTEVKEPKPISKKDVSSLISTPTPKPSPAVIEQLTRGTKFTKDFEEVPMAKGDNIFGYDRNLLKQAIVAQELGPYLQSVGTPYFFTGVSKKKVGTSSSGFGPGQIIASTAKNLMSNYPNAFKDEGFREYTLKFIQQGENKLNLDYHNSLYKDGNKVTTTDNDKKIFGKLGKGNIPIEEHEKYYNRLFDLVIDDKLKQSDNIDSFLNRYHGSKKKAENKKYTDSVLGYLNNPNTIGEDIKKQIGEDKAKLQEADNFIKSFFKKLGFNEGGMAQAKQMDMFDEGGLLDEGGEVDQESGNEVPPGSLRKEVRDDIPAMLSEGEFVFPADVVRFIGLENLMELRQRAKAGLKRMEEMGQMGNSEDATIPDDIPFTIDDLELEEEKPMMRRMQQGGDVNDPYAMEEFVPDDSPIVPPSNLIGGDRGKTQFTKVYTYKGPDGDTINIPGRIDEKGNFIPLYPIPNGYEFVEEYVPPTEEEDTTEEALTPAAPKERDREEELRRRSEAEEQKDRSYENYIQNILTDKDYEGDNSFESILENRGLAKFGGTGIPIPKFLFNEEELKKAYDRLKSDVATPTLKTDVFGTRSPTQADRTAAEIASDAQIQKVADIDPRFAMGDDETFGLTTTGSLEEQNIREIMNAGFTREQAIEELRKSGMLAPKEKSGLANIGVMPASFTGASPFTIDGSPRQDKTDPTIQIPIPPGSTVPYVGDTPFIGQGVQGTNIEGRGVTDTAKLLSQPDFTPIATTATPDRTAQALGTAIPTDTSTAPSQLQSELDKFESDKTGQFGGAGFNFMEQTRRDLQDEQRGPDPKVLEDTRESRIDRSQKKADEEAERQRLIQVEAARKKAEADAYLKEQEIRAAQEAERERLIQVEAARKEAQARAIKEAQLRKQAEAEAAAYLKQQQDRAAEAERQRLIKVEADRKAAEAAAAKKKADEEALARREKAFEKDEPRTPNVIKTDTGTTFKGGKLTTNKKGEIVKVDDKPVVVKDERTKPQEKEDKSDDKIVCTAMNNQYGFGSFRQTIWLNQSKTLDKHYQIGYHTIFKPVVRYMYADNKLSNRIVRWWGEGVARRRTADIWLQKKGKRHFLGAVERAILEPLCYVVGKLNGRTN